MPIPVRIKCPTCDHIQSIMVADENEKQKIPYEEYKYKCWRASCKKTGQHQKGWKVVY